MLYPVLPVYLKSIGFSALLIGILEGIAEATAGLSKGYFGNMSDRLNRRAPFIRTGYFLSSVSKPMLALFTYPMWIFFARTLDRLGKGIRTSARDTVLSFESTPETKARIFGLHRGFDTLGAFAGPVFALIFLSYYPDNFNALFLIAFIPGILSVSLTFFLKDKIIGKKTSIQETGFFSFIKFWKVAGKDYKNLVTGLLVFSLINSSDVFLLLMAKHIGFSNTGVISLYIFYNFVYAVFSYPVGILADKMGLKNIFATGLFIFSIVYGAMALQLPDTYIYAAFFLYGIYASATESVSKAWISNITEKEDTATAIGFYSAFNSISVMLASFIAGFLWFSFFPSLTFIVSSLVSFVLIFYFLSIKQKPLIQNSV